MVICTHRGKEISVTFKYMDKSRVMRANVYGQGYYDYGYVALLYVDDKQFVLLSKTTKDSCKLLIGVD